MTDADSAKRNAARAALDHVEDGMIIGLGTGSTAAIFIEELGRKVREGFNVAGVPTSEQTEKLAREAGLDIMTPDETTIIDVAIDGADEVTPGLELIKGGGGALMREKIVAQAAAKMIVIADQSKRVPCLGRFPLPIEVDPFCWALSVRQIRDVFAAMGFENRPVQLRGGPHGAFRSDGGHLIVDCALKRIAEPAALHSALIGIAGVIETGLFCDIADIAIFGDVDGIETAHR